MNKPLPRRKNSLRKPDYDYAQSGAYFVTICTYQRLHHFGAITAETMHLSSVGQIAAECLRGIPQHHQQVELDDFVVMPNHVHGILLLLGDERDERPQLGLVVGTFKAAVTRSVKRANILLDDRLWQRGYHDHIIRNERDYLYIKQYVQINPARWETDTFYG